ncbi:MAG: hypothetical protein PHW58_06315 [Candidatus Methanofastidiosa archaeon]|nr:hypothetical protein [Candidatus Methanofastidiosa archaeon]
MGKFPYIAFILFIALVSSCACIGGEQENTPEATVRTYYQGLNDRNVSLVIGTLSKSVIENAGGTKAIQTALGETMADLDQYNLIFEIDTLQETIRGYQATVELELKIYPKGSENVSRIPYTFELIIEDGRWKIQDIN